ncbi:MAG: NAD(P)-binding domain-containing protein, partial [Dehalococcoidia bacterium]
MAIVGAGPYGLSIATHLRSRGIEFRIFGSTMRTWLDMPPGVALKSFDFATNIYTPWPGHTFKEWAAARGQALEEPIPMSVFAEYGVEIQTQLVPEVEDVEVRSVVPAAGGGFGVTLSTGESFDADSVVVAVGLKSYARMPATFANHPGRVFHTSDIPDYARFRGQDVTVIGGGQSALEAG